ncbi:MAG: HEAT repeat domain-containing protein [Deltaproteobacteria bacterium]|nr:HEAT repeat domain-containing protein [Deltaproteobacteria bacterium]
MSEGQEVESKALENSAEIPIPEGTELSEEFIQARDLVNTFVKTIKAFRLYPPENPSLRGFRDSLCRKMKGFLSQYHFFHLQIGEYDFSYKDTVLYENRELKFSLAFLMYKDGLRELRFIEGLEDQEVQELIEIIRQGDSINKMEDDLVTLIWERDFVHISYLATDEFFEDNPLIVPETIDQFRGHLVFQPLARHVEGDILEEGMEDELLDEILSQRIEQTPPLVWDVKVNALGAAELEGLRRELETEIHPHFVFNTMDILLEILALESNPEPFQDAAQVLGKMVDAFLNLGEFPKAAALLRQISLFLKDPSFQPWQVKIIQQILENLGEAQRIERLGVLLDKDERIPAEDIGDYLKLLRPNAIPPLIKVLGLLKNSKMRRIFCDVLVEIGRDQVELFLPFMEDRRWYLVRNIAYILGRIGREEAIPALQKVLQHDDLRVRKEVVQALGTIGGPKTVGLLMRALNEPDPRIRSMAVVCLGRSGNKSSLAHILEAVQAKEFSKKDPVEVRAFFEAIGLAGSNRAVPVLQKLLEQKSWFGGGKKEEVRAGAAQALALLGTPEAKAVLEGGLNSREESIRQACRLALKAHLSQGGGV